jgi:hypothetical protein
VNTEDGLYRHGVPADVVGINNDGLIAGTAQLTQGFPGFGIQRFLGFTLNTRTSAVNTLPLPYPYNSSNARAINNNGYILGYIWGDSGLTSAVWTPAGAVLDLGFPLIYGTISDDQVVGVGCPSYACALYRWDLPSEKIVVELSLDHPEVQPVLVPYFNALTQDAECPAAAVDCVRLDLLHLTVRAHLDGSSAPIQNATLALTATAQDGTGGHTAASHGGVRPNGTFWPAGVDPNAVDGIRDSISVPVTALEASYPYLTSGVSGVERITATVTANGLTATASAQVTIQYVGLQPLARLWTTYQFTNQNGSGSQRHGNINNFLQPDFSQGVQNAFQYYFANVPAENRFLFGDTCFWLNDASLQLGGLLDVGAFEAWGPPHITHRTGEDLDVRWWNVYDDDQFQASCLLAGITCEVHCNAGTLATGAACPVMDPIWATQRHYHLSP